VRQEQVALREIEVSTQGKKPEEIPDLKKKAETTLQRIKDGEDFGEMASGFPTAYENARRVPGPVQARRTFQGTRRQSFQNEEKRADGSDGNEAGIPHSAGAGAITTRANSRSPK